MISEPCVTREHNRNFAAQYLSTPAGCIVTCFPLSSGVRLHSTEPKVGNSAGRKKGGIRFENGRIRLPQQRVVKKVG
jgi:hypothetical protein